MTAAQQVQANLAEMAKRRRYNALAYYEPYDKQREFHNAGGRYAQRLLMAGNRVGKTLAGSREVAMHMTGLYPEWWSGLRFEKPITMWACGVSSLEVRDSVQKLLLGVKSDYGTGAIPQKLLRAVRPSRGVVDAVDTFFVQHVSGMQSSCTFKSYEQGVEKFQAATLDFVWFDEEPPSDIFEEGETRTATTGGNVMLTFTPLKGMSLVVKGFTKNPRADQHVTRMTIYDALHFDQESAGLRIAKYADSPFAKARLYGEPVLGSGMVYPIERSAIEEPMPQIAPHWARIAGIDFGWDHATAVVWLAHDRDTDTVHLYDAYKVRQQTPVVHASACRARGLWIPMAWPQDGLQHDKGSGRQIAQLYRDEGLSLTNDPAAYENKSRGVEDGIADILGRMQTMRLRVANHLNDWWDEMSGYYREKGVIVKEDDDLLDATRYAIMMLRHAKSEAEHQMANGRRYRPAKPAYNVRPF